MFSYTDPAKRNFLGNQAAQAEFVQRLRTTYDSFARRPNSAFTWIEAFDHLANGQLPQVRSVDWRAFPLTATAPNDKAIDSDRFSFQDEYVEWRAEKKGTKLAKVTFTTEFPEYFEAFAAVGIDALTQAVQDVIPGANPTEADLFGPDFHANASTPLARAQTFRRNLAKNPWNNGTRGILCLTQRFNTLEALFNLLTACGVPQTSGTPQDTCGLVGGACGPGRSSDPAICTVGQSAVRAGVAYTLRDPAGIRFLSLEGVWKLNNAIIDVNDAASNQGIWVVSRNGRRAVLTIPTGLTLDGTALVTGAQVSHKVAVVADLLTAPDAALPDWARISAESGSRGPS
jgi:hypothetical protein